MSCLNLSPNSISNTVSENTQSCYPLALYFFICIMKLKLCIYYLGCKHYIFCTSNVFWAVTGTAYGGYDIICTAVWEVAMGDAREREKELLMMNWLGWNGIFLEKLNDARALFSSAQGCNNLFVVLRGLYSFLPRTSFQNYYFLPYVANTHPLSSLTYLSQQDILSFTRYYIKHNVQKYLSNPDWLFYRIWQADANIYMVMIGMKNSQMNIKKNKSGSLTLEIYCGWLE